jgi:hypothetical protein
LLSRQAVGALLGLALVLSGCSTTTGHGVATPKTATPKTATSTASGGVTSKTAASSSSASSSSSTPSPSATVAPQPRYVPPADGSGYSNAQLDQRQPLPGLLAVNRCDWLPLLVTRLKKMGATGTEKSDSGCDVSFPDHEVVEVTVIEDYSALDQDTTYLKPTTVDGLQARYYSLVPLSTDRGCSVELNTRSLSDLTVSAYNDTHSKGNFRAHCRRAGQAAAIVAKTFVPLAGGHPWSGTPQQPSAASLQGVRACGLVDVGSVIFAHELEDEHPRSGRTARGTTCEYSSNDSGTVHVLLTTSRSGLAAVPATPHSTVLPTKLGVLPARTEQIDIACTVAAQLITGQVVQVTYTLAPGLTGYPDVTESTCLATRSVLSSALMDAMREQ